jgi:alpha-amylase
LGIPTFPTYDARKIDVASVNLSDPEVQTFFRKWFVSWVDPHGDGSCKDGVDGFRIDHMMDDLDSKGKIKNLFATFWGPIFGAVRTVSPHVKVIAEQADWGYGENWLTRGGVDMVFAFPLRKAIVSFDKSAIYQAIRETTAKTPAGKGQLTFIENHDVNRFGSEVKGNRPKEKVGAALDVLLPGIPLIYYGQELGMLGKQSTAWGSDANDIPVREAFRWARDLQAPGSAIWYQGSQPWWNDRFNRTGDGISVEEESNDSGSLLSFYRTLLAIRAGRSELQMGRPTLLCESAPTVVCLVRTWGRARSLIIVNLAETPSRVEFTPAEVESGGLTGSWIDLLDHNRPTNPHAVTVAGLGVRLLATR